MIPNRVGCSLGPASVAAHTPPYLRSSGLKELGLKIEFVSCFLTGVRIKG